MTNNNLLQHRPDFSQGVGLERMAMLVSELGHPHKQFKAIHIAGTNGKGSVAAFIHRILQEHGYKVGLYTSPHLRDYRERFCINQALISPAELEKITKNVNETIARIEQAHPEYGSFTVFDVTTAIGFVYFAQQQVDYAVIEVGLGGRLDATNVLVPEISVITPIGHDHQDRLGDSLTEVALEKAGIIKSGVPVVSGSQVDQVAQVLFQVATERNCDFYSIDSTNWQPVVADLTGGKLIFGEVCDEPLEISLLGAHQLANAATALLALRVLHNRGLELDLALVRRGLASTVWPGRLELVSEQPLTILDGAHNQEGILALAHALESLLLSAKITFIIGMSGNKSPELLKPLLPLADEMIFTEYTSGRYTPTSAIELSKYASSHGVANRVIPSLPSALAAAADAEVLCICGSLYLVGDMKAYLPSGK